MESNDLNSLFNSLKLYDEKNSYILTGDLNAEYSDWSDSEINPRVPEKMVKKKRDNI